MKVFAETPRVRQQASQDRREKADSQIGLMQQRLKASETELQSITECRKQLADHARRTLAGDPAIATADFHKRLLTLTRQHGLNNAVLTPHRPQRIHDRMVAVPFSISMDASLQQLYSLLLDLDQPGSLRRITFISAEPKTLTDDPQLDCRLQVETVCINIPGIADADRIQPPRVAASTRPAFAFVNNPFAVFNSPSIVTRQPTPAVQPATTLELVGLVEDAENSEAWLLDRRTGQNHIVKLNNRFQHESLVGRLLNIKNDRATIEFADARYELAIGDTTRPVSRMATKAKARQ